jgi:hypothetical protein
VTYFITNSNKEREKAWILASLVSKHKLVKVNKVLNGQVKTFGNVKEKQPTIKRTRAYFKNIEKYGV